MATRRQERTPLIGARQAPPQHDPYSPSMEDFDKTDRRPMMGRVNAALSSMFSPVNSTPRAVRTRRTPEKKQDEKEDYYEDTFNDYPWRCTFGTREDVSADDKFKVMIVCRWRTTTSNLAHSSLTGWNLDESKRPSWGYHVLSSMGAYWYVNGVFFHQL
jgi:hypothetical protein